MNVGDAIGGNINVPANGNVSIAPVDGSTWLIQNISLTGPFKLSFASNGHVTGGITSAVASGYITFLNNLLLYCNSTNYWVIYNTDSVDHDFTYNGIIINDGTNGAISIGSLSTLLDGQSMNIQPPSGQEWEINQIMSTGTGTVYWMPEHKNVSAIVGNSWFGNLKLAITNSHYLAVSNNSGGTYYYSYAGSRTK
jgi:hypothetical protein